MRQPVKAKGEEMTIMTEEMWQCQVANCGYIYNPAKGDRKGNISPGTSFEDLSEIWKCPLCHGGKRFCKKIG